MSVSCTISGGCRQPTRRSRGFTPNLQGRSRYVGIPNIDLHENRYSTVEQRTVSPFTHLDVTPSLNGVCFYTFGRDTQFDLLLFNLCIINFQNSLGRPFIPSHKAKCEVEYRLMLSWGSIGHHMGVASRGAVLLMWGGRRRFRLSQSGKTKRRFIFRLVSGT